VSAQCPWSTGAGGTQLEASKNLLKSRAI